MVLVLTFLLSCKKHEPHEVNPPNSAPSVRAVDISALPEIRMEGSVFYNESGTPKDFLSIIKDAGINSVRLRLWVDPDSVHSSLTEVLAFSTELRQMGFNLWLTIHYSDTWADPGNQSKPRAWEKLDYSELLDTMYSYTYMVSDLLKPEIIQIGNEINHGFLNPEGARSNSLQFHALLAKGLKAAKDASPNSKRMLHYAGHEGSEYFFAETDSLDFDLIGISYYPYWHGKNMDSLTNKLSQLGSQYQREVLIAETAYPFTLGFNDWTHNIVGLQNQLIEEYAASPEGQRRYLLEIRKICEENSMIDGFCYWGAELIAWKGPQSLEGSPWENQALFDFNNTALPALQAFDPN